MNIKSGLIAGMSYEECTQLREWWKDMARNGPCVANPTHFHSAPNFNHQYPTRLLRWLCQRRLYP